MVKVLQYVFLFFTPLKIYNGTALAVPREIQGQPLPINELKGKPPMEVCPVLNLHRCKKGKIKK